MNEIKNLFAFTVIFINITCAQDSGIVEVQTTKQAVELVNNWDPNVYFFMDEENPITSLEGIQREEYACWGMELFKQLDTLMQVLGLPGEGIKLLGDGAYNSPEGKKPMVYITWKDYEKFLTGARRFILVEKKE